MQPLSFSETGQPAAPTHPGAAAPAADAPLRRPATGFPWSRITRFLKLMIAAGLGCAALYAMLSEQGYVASENAVVSSYTISVRSPAAGMVVELRTAVGDVVSEGAVLARVADPRMDDARLVDLRQRAAREQAELEATQRQRTDLLAIAQDLQRRTAAHDKVAAKLRQQGVEEARRTLASLAARANQAWHEVTRTATLAQDGWAPAAQLERQRTDLEVAGRDVSAQSARLDMAATESEAAAQGILLQSGSNDVAYSAQRADEVRLRIVDVDHAQAVLAAARSETLARLDSEERRLSLLRGADLKAPTSGVVWKVGTSEGERMGLGDTAVEIVNCQAGFVIAAIPQDRFGDVAIGAKAFVRLSGETKDRVGTVLNVTGEGSITGERNLAAAPISGHEAMAMARVALPLDANVCLIGRTARVRLPALEGSDIIARTIRRFL